MPFVKGNTIGAETRFKTGQSGNPAGRPPDKLEGICDTLPDERVLQPWQQSAVRR